jgi:hypothetical protein
MITESFVKEPHTLPNVVHRLQTLEKQIQFINTRLQFQPTLPRFEFVIEIDEQIVWTGLDLPHQYTQIRQQYPNQELTISWRSSPVVWI